MDSLNSKCKERLDKMTIDRTPSLLFDTYFGTQLTWMYRGIEYTMKKESAHSCALLLSTYTEVLGGLVTGNLQELDQMRNNYVTFLGYLGGHYVALHEKYDLYKIIRNKLVHEFSPKPSYIIWVSESPSKDKFGIEIVDGNLNINLQEYYRDFKNGVEKYCGEFNEKGMIMINFIKALKRNWDEVSYKPKSELPKNDNNRELEDAIRYIDLTLERIQAELKEPLEKDDFVPNQIMVERLLSLRISLENNRKPVVKEIMTWSKTEMPPLYDYLISKDFIKKYMSI